MAKEVYMPKAGMDMQQGVIVKWLVEVGQQVGEGDALLEIETDKVNMEVESPADGVLLCKYFEEGDAVPVVTVIGYVGQPGESVPDRAEGANVESMLASQDEQIDLEPASPPGDARDPFLPPLEQQFDFDVAVIGGGPAGYVAAIKAAMLGGKVVLFEKDTVGGTCLNRGCIPTKTYLKTAEQVQHIKQAGKRGIVVDGGVSVDMPKVYAYKQRVVKKLTGGVASLLKSRGVSVIKGEARLKEAWVVECGGKEVTAANVILCGGSRPGSVPIPGIDHERVLDSDGILELQQLPGRLAVIGGGVIGCELATAFAGLGSEVSIIELMDRLVPMMDEEISTGIAKSMRAAGVKVHTGTQVQGIEPAAEGVTVRLEGESIAADYVLLAIGRVADTDCLGSMAEYIMAEKGRVIVDEYCQTNLQNVYACGDMTTASTLAHSAFKMGETAAANAMGQSETVNLAAVPSCLYTQPEAAGVGLSQAEAAKRQEIIVGRFPFAANGRALASGEPEGFVKVIADSRYGEILGVHILGANATEMIAEAKLLMDMEITVHEAADVMHAHPTYSEALMEACADALGRCIHLP